jgi:hypothetical protein
LPDALLRSIRIAVSGEAPAGGVYGDISAKGLMRGAALAAGRRI